MQNILRIKNVLRVGVYSGGALTGSTSDPGSVSGTAGEQKKNEFKAFS